jgi:hypothetical protein
MNGFSVYYAIQQYAPFLGNLHPLLSGGQGILKIYLSVGGFLR